ncbi:beta-lactamase class D [Breoghania corrubedonensis]|uniref:Beta-lactamase n=1 Tax=Breoghania corrubedonensis TaxID=665038 RepID=A0A2T5V1L5_9HYPH|nr:class D beta-lactamase [Breoghania corrubedonensis]PTW57620.1 beta-lactamase class D [Breoghania corrubedonensis]
MSARPLSLAAALLMALSVPAAAATKTICTIVAEAPSGKIVKKEGMCDRRVTPASTFKLAIALMGYDSGFLIDTQTPELPFKKGYIDWRPQWRHAQTPQSWLRESVVWYSQQITRHLGAERFKAYVDAFDYGNRDVSGDRGKDNGLTNAWLSSFLRISPKEQIAFLLKLANRELPVSEKAYEMTAAISDYDVQPSGWHVHGKTGAGLPVRADGTKVRGKAYGWFVGWADRGDRTVVFARLIQDGAPRKSPPSFRARDGLLKDLFSTANPLK